MIRHLVAVVAASTLALIGTADAQRAIVIKFSHVVAPDTPKGRGAEKFKELAEKYTEGKVRVDVYPNAQLYKDDDEIEALRSGHVHMLAPSLAKFGPVGVRAFEVFDLPFILPTREALRKITEGPLGKRLLGQLEGKGLKGLAYWDNGFKIMSANRPLRMPADFAGLKMRIQPSQVLAAQMRALGATPQVMIFSEVYGALANGKIDGTENPPSNMFTQKMHEVQKHATISNHGYIGYAVITNKNFWDGLPADIRRALDKAMLEATQYTNAIAQQNNEDALAAMTKAGTTTFYELTVPEKTAWQKALEPVHQNLAVRVGKELIYEFYREGKVAGAN